MSSSGSSRRPVNNFPQSASTSTNPSSSSSHSLPNLHIHISEFSDSSEVAESPSHSQNSDNALNSDHEGSSSSLEEDGSNSEESDKSDKSVQSLVSSSSEQRSSQSQSRRAKAPTRPRTLRPAVKLKKGHGTSLKRRQLKKKRSSGRSSSPPLHYRNYYQHHHLRVDKFSITKLIRAWVLRMTLFLSKYHKEICLGFFFIASGFAGLRTGPLKTRTVPTPSPFFSPDEVKDLVQDNYQGEYVDLARKIIPYSPAFILYYAPWDSESVDAKSEFLKVAKHFHRTRPGLIKFIAVNCWWPDGQCRQNYKSLSHYPILVVHVGSHSGIIYGGPIRVEMMIRFIESALMPFTRLDSEEELMRFRAQHDAIMLASFNFSAPDTEPAYDTYRQMALRNLESDPFSQVGYGLFLRQELGDKYFLSSSNSISLVLFNEIHTAKWIGSYQEKGLKGPVGQVADWVAERAAKPPVTWSYGVRNGYANSPIALGPYNLYQELMKGPIFLLITRRYFPSAFSPFYSQVKEVALDYFNCHRSVNVTKLRRKTHLLTTEWMTLWKYITEICRKSKPLSHNCQLMWDQFVHWEKRKRYYVKESLAHYEAVSKALNFTGFSCESSRPFRFLAVDPFHLPHFTKLALGFNVNTERANETSHEEGIVDSQDPQAFIIDAQNELILPFTTFNISEIATTIHSFTKQVESGDLHFPSSQLRNEGKAEEKPVFTRPVSSYVIHSFNSEQLLEFLTHEGPSESPLLLMHTTQYMGYCGVTLAQFVRLGKFLEKYQINITLAKIDNFKNSLPNHMAPEKIPAFVFYPAQRRSDSRIFPYGQEITAQSLLRFVLSELEPATRVNMSLQSINKFPGTRPVGETLESSNSAAVLRQIESILQSVRKEPSLSQMHEDLTHSDLKIDLTKRAISDWKYELLDHLRSMRITLDVEK